MIRRLTALVLLAVLGTSCGGIPKRTFEIRAINNQGAPIKCLIIVDRKWPTSMEEATFTDAELEIGFRRRDMHVIVQPARIVDGELQIPEATEVGEYHQAHRDIRIDDPRVHLFIVNRNPNFSDF